MMMRVVWVCRGLGVCGLQAACSCRCDPPSPHLPAQTMCPALPCPPDQDGCEGCPLQIQQTFGEGGGTGLHAALICRQARQGAREQGGWIGGTPCAPES